MTPLEPMSDYTLQHEAEAALNDLARAKGRLELVMASLPGREADPELCGRLVAISDQARRHAQTSAKISDNLHHAAQRQLAQRHGYAANVRGS